MEFFTDYMKLIQLLDGGLINRLNESKPAKLLERDLEKAKQVKTLLESMIEDNNRHQYSLEKSLTRLVTLEKKTGFLNKWFGKKPIEEQKPQNGRNRTNCLVLLGEIGGVICDLGILHTKVSEFLDENSNLKTFDDGERA